MHRQKTSMAEVADAAGVSSATVDRVLNGRGGVRREKERRVLEWAQKLKLDRDLNKLQLRCLRIAVLIPKPTSSYYFNLSRGFNLAQAKYQSSSITCLLNYFDTLDPSTMIGAIHRAIPKADGLIIVAYNHPKIAAAVNRASRSIPVVTLTHDLPETDRVAYVGVDNRLAGRIAGELMGRFVGPFGGQILVITGMRSFLGYREREEGFHSVLRRRFPTCEVVDSIKNGMNDRIDAEIEKDKIGKLKNLKGIYNASNDDPAVAGVLKTARRESSIVMIGHELTDSSRDLLIDGTMDAVLDQNPSAQAVRAVEVMLQHYARNCSPVSPLQMPISVVFPESVPGSVSEY